MFWSTHEQKDLSASLSQGNASHLIFPLHSVASQQRSLAFIPGSGPQVFSYV